MTLYIQFIPKVLNKLRGRHQSGYKPCVTKYVNAEVSKLSGVFNKTDGSNQPTADIDFNKQTITNIRKSKSANEPLVRKELDYLHDAINPMYKKHMNH